MASVLNGYRRGRVRVGDTFGKLTVLEFSHSDIQNRHWRCLCDCGKLTTVRTRSLRSSQTQSCGCLQKEVATTHGKWQTPEAAIWRNMKYRCSNPNAANYKIYGARGIKVCDRWLNSFQNFIDDMGERPSKLHSIDRKDVNGDYAPENCVWATNKEQSRNRRDNRLITYKGVTKSIIEFCEEYGLKHHQLTQRLNSGWSVEKSLLTPIRLRSN